MLEEGDDLEPRLINALKIDERWLERFPWELSGGELLRFCLARSRGKRTRYLLGDEIDVYKRQANGTLISFLDRLFYSARYFDKTMKVGASVAVARRGGLSATFDELNKYFTISGMPVASSQYWNSIHGAGPGEALQDQEGLQTMRTLARNMTFLMRSIAPVSYTHLDVYKRQHMWAAHTETPPMWTG